MKKYINLILLLVLTATITASDLNWRSFENAQQIAKSENKIILIDFYTDWCGWCKKMDNETYSNETIINLLNEDFVTVKINPEKQGNIKLEDQTISWERFAAEVGVSGFPATAFFTPNNQLIDLVPGYYDPENMELLLNFMSKGMYQKISFQDYRLFNEVQTLASIENSSPELDFVLGYFHLRFFGEKEKAYKSFKSALDKELQNKELYAALHLSANEKEKQSNNWLAKAEENGYTDESQLDDLIIRYVKDIFSSE